MIILMCVILNNVINVYYVMCVLMCENNVCVYV